MKILLLDNNDSFVYNLFHLIRSVQPNEASLTIQNIDKFDVTDIVMYSHVILSPGPGLPHDFPKLEETIKRCAILRISILGVCLGHQAIAEVFGGSLSDLSKPLHGVQSVVEISRHNALFHNIPHVLKVGRYHSWIVNREQLPCCFEITAVDSQNIIMGISHKKFNIHGIQFHPESYMTEHGKQLISNFLKLQNK